MPDPTRDLRALSLARGGPRRWALKLLAGGAFGLGMLTHGQRVSAAAADQFEQCMRACRTSCGQNHHCPSPEHCAASCSQAAW